MCVCVIGSDGGHNYNFETLHDKTHAEANLLLCLAICLILAKSTLFNANAMSNDQLTNIAVQRRIHKRELCCKKPIALLSSCSLWTQKPESVTYVIWLAYIFLSFDLKILLISNL